MTNDSIPQNLPKLPSAGNTMPILEQFALHMRRKRKILRLSQTELAFLTDTSQTAIARIEANQGNPSVGLIQRIASALELECNLIVRPRR
jgi:predicted transcriptional regulator